MYIRYLPRLSTVAAPVYELELEVEMEVGKYTDSFVSGNKLLAAAPLLEYRQPD